MVDAFGSGDQPDWAERLAGTSGARLPAIRPSPSAMCLECNSTSMRISLWVKELRNLYLDS
jgi:hypothetical protein